MLDLDLIKLHLRVDGDDDNDLLQHYWDAAVSAFETFTNRSLVDESTALPDPPGNALHPTRSIEQGLLLLIGHWYANRESVITGTLSAELPLTSTALWGPHRWSNL